MTPNTIQLLVADDNLELCDILKDFFEITPEITLCGAAHDGEEALFRIAQCQPDVVLLDLILPKIDGISVLERLSHAGLTKRPKIIVTSAIGQESFTSTALSLGADYYMIKPYDLEALRSRINLVAAHMRESAPPQEAVPKQGSRETMITRMVMSLGIPTNMLGYRYCISALQILLRENRPCSIVKDVYANVAQEFSTTPACVEGAIRKAIRRVWEQNGSALHTLLTADGDVASGPPSNGQVLTALSARIRIMWESSGTPESGNTVIMR